jgi:predicted nucleotidyltransferase
MLTLNNVQEIKGHIEQIQQLCSAHNVKSLFAFGSAVSGNLKPESDIDLIVDIDNNDPIDYSDDYFALKFQLEELFKRPIDLLEDKAVKNPLLKKQIDNSKVLVYGK